MEKLIGSIHFTKDKMSSVNIGGIAFGILLSAGGILTYLPQFYSIVKQKNVDGISEATLVILNMASMCLCMNSLIYTWPSFFCRELECVAQILTFVTLSVSWLMVLVYYCVFIYYKFKTVERRVLSGLSYCFTYVLFAVFIASLLLGEKLGGNTGFFTVFEKVLGISSAVLYGLVYLPQIWIIFRSKSTGSNSILMYILQTPGNLVLIYYLAILSRNPITTWITYLVIFTEQAIILMLLIYYWKKEKAQEDVEAFTKQMQKVYLDEDELE